MLNKKIIVAATLSAVMLAGCSNGTGGSSGGSNNSSDISSSAEESKDELKEASYSASEENVKLLGRTYFGNGSLYCALSGTGAEFTFTGTKCTVTVAGDSNSGSASAKDNQARVAIYVNGERVIDDMVDHTEEVYTVFESETPQEVTVSVVKLTESPHSTIAISSINVTGSAIKPTAAKDKLIEFIGDSITCGYGVDDPDKNHHFSTTTEDVTKTYAYKTAEALNADYSMVSYSGYGIISGYSDGENKVSAQTLPLYYTKVGYSWASNGDFVPANIEWDFTKRQPDVVVINLGTNDDSYTKDIEERQEEYRAGYVEFLKTVREKNPDAKILCTLGIMGDRLFKQVQKAVDDYVEETGDKNVSAMRFRVQSPGDGYSADWHPSVKTHEKASKLLVEEINKILG